MWNFFSSSSWAGALVLVQTSLVHPPTDFSLPRHLAPQGTGAHMLYTGETGEDQHDHACKTIAINIDRGVQKQQ
tara:strand:- start:938 stop:1159 length:222 start_codon:yes stop_codon:yes gene_type:complete